MPLSANRPTRAPVASSTRLLAPGALRAVVQPVVRLADGEVIGYEALARATDGDVAGSPEDWFARAAADGWSAALEAACLRAVVALGPPPEGRLLFVNVLPRHLLAPEVLAVRELLPSRVVLELTEQEAIADVAAVRAALGRWTGGGASVALDDVGSGYAGLQQVVHLQPEFLKLDRSLITGIDGDRVRQAMVASLVGFAGQVGTTIIAEGIESNAELRWLRDAGVPLAQGYHLAEPGEPWPVPSDAAAAALGRDGRAAATERLAGTRSVSEACAVVADELFALGDVMPSVYLESAGRLRCRAQRGLWQVLDGMRADAGITGRTFRTGESILVPDVRDDEGYLEAIPGVAAEYCTPITAGGRVIGALNVESRSGLSDAVCREVDGFAEVLGRHLERLPVEQVVPMRRLGRKVGTLFERRDTEGTTAAVVAAACELVGTDSAAVVVGTGRAARIDLAVGPLADALGSLDADDLARLAELLEPLTSCYSSGEATGLAFTGGESLRRAGACAVVAVPLGAGHRRTGVLLLAHTGPLALGPDLIEPVELLAVVAGSCLENAEHVSAVERRARLDPLTGLANHASFHEAMQEAANGGGFAVAMFDIDRFKQVNDTWGHLFGDRILAARADAWAAGLPPDCTLFRVGGDEFAAILPAVPGAGGGDTAIAIAGELADAARTVLRLHGAGISGGLAWQGEGEDPMDTLHRADEALYVAKGTGGGVRRAGAPHVALVLPGI
jgi:diguanylate cyclase (GGDEF)-like protein